MSFLTFYLHLHLLLIAANVHIEARLNEHPVGEEDINIGDFNLSHHSKHKKKHSTGTNTFDFYVLSMSYQPEFCDSHRYNHFVGCENPNDFWRSSLTLHGLWPQRSDGTWPATCSNESFSLDTVNEIGMDRFLHYWPNTKASPNELKKYTEFWAHEWGKHGTCSGLPQKQYFDVAMDHFLPTPSLVQERYGSTVTKSELTNAYGDDGGMVTFICSGKYLSEVRVCIQKSGKDGTATERMKCTDDVLQEGNCSDEIYIPKFYSDKDEHSLFKDTTMRE
mmetsp:Transcript_5259/g.4922  ORF Transcript_5259/g.4922 Transcript_5259/m.4922 type:complete len:277 (-) Transcript_5259:161-991(-)|eukprot:CAMPEP_0197831938 /NCGR_PEP_ID=MMETSP1437-20131217/12840_1 /TAXON_ID=49252 ORGANISM="Eucampia antarctica, Strain CCMP1452" /NCGR_SAMPLE_ID=MMETSP1437 /ASSEMBLY_ACC=CAM_ASM_001096 /LENGTH=276 /DNA_ID=CAMNT_0043435091 /DNA_START=66 /DNA_END=896 /DNA_ORIENTATION=+